MSTQRETERIVINATVYCVGVKKRCRKPDVHIFELGDYQPAKIDENAVIEKAVDTVNSNMRSLQPGRAVHVTCAEHKLTDYGNGIIMRSFMLYGGTEKKIDITERFADAERATA